MVAISPDFTPTAMHASQWLNPKPGTDTALAMAMVQTILNDRAVDWDYVREQTDLPFLVRRDTGKFLRGTDLEMGDQAVGGNLFYVWDETSRTMVSATATGLSDEEKATATLRLGDVHPALEGAWTVETRNGSVEVIPVFELVKELVEDYTPEKVAQVTGVNAENIREIARTFAASRHGMIYGCYRASKWLHGDKLQRAWLLMCALTGATGQEGGGLQTTQMPNGDGVFNFVFDGIGPRIRIAAISLWDYAHGNLKELNSAVYGEELAEHFDQHYREAIRRGWVPDYGVKPWKMAIFAGHNPANWRASGQRWRETTLASIDTIVTMTPDMGTTALYSDYVLPVAHHYEREDFILEGRTPYLHVVGQAVHPLGEALDDPEIMGRLARAISKRATERGISPIEDSIFGQSITRDYTKCDELLTLNGKVGSTRDLMQFLIDNSAGLPKVSVDELGKRGIIRVDNAQDVQFGPDSPYSYEILASTRDKRPYKTLTGRQQFYIDHDWFLQEGEQLPVQRGPLSVPGYPLRMMMGHARHGIHSMYRDDSLLVSLQRGEPDTYVNPRDAEAREVADGDLIRVFNSAGSFIAMAHVTPGLRAGTLFMYHGWDPMMFRGRQNFGAVVSTAGLIKPTSLSGDYEQLNFRTPDAVPNQTFNDFTCDFERFVDA